MAKPASAAIRPRAVFRDEPADQRPLHGNGIHVIPPFRASAVPYRERSRSQQEAGRPMALVFNRDFAPPVGEPVTVAPGVGA